MYNCVILIGPPCSGKSTIGHELADIIHYRYVSSGDIARKLANSDELKRLNNGEMFNEDIMRYEVHNVLSMTDDVILDGFPRFCDQLIWLMENFPDAKYTFVHIKTPIIEMMNRAINRGRSDDTSIGDRIEYYMKNTIPVLNMANELGYTILEVKN